LRNLSKTFYKPDFLPVAQVKP